MAARDFLQPLIAVADVEASSRWYQRLLGCQSAHGGSEYERLVCGGTLVLQLHRWEEEHHHGRIGDPNDVPPGNGLLLWFEVDDFDEAVGRAQAMGAEVLLPRHRNPPDGNGPTCSRGAGWDTSSAASDSRTISRIGFIRCTFARWGSGVRSRKLSS